MHTRRLIVDSSPEATNFDDPSTRASCSNTLTSSSILLLLLPFLNADVFINSVMFLLTNPAPKTELLIEIRSSELFFVNVGFKEPLPKKFNVGWRRMLAVVDILVQQLHEHRTRKQIYPASHLYCLNCFAFVSVDAFA